MISLGIYTHNPEAGAGPRILAEDHHLRGYVDRPWFRAYVARHLGFRQSAREKTPTGPAAVTPEEFARHGLLCGATGSGKSRLLEHLVDEQLREGCSVVLIDPKGETADHVLARVAAGGFRPDRVTLLDPRGGAIPGWNPLQCGVPLPQAVGDLVALVEQSSSSWGPRLQDLLTNTLLVVGAHGLSLYEATKFLVREEYREQLLRQAPPVRKSLAYTEAQQYFAEEFGAWSRGERANAVTPVLNKVREVLRSEFLRPLLCARRNTLELRRLWRRSELVVVRLDRTALGEEGARLLAGLLAHLLYRTALRDPGPVPVVLAIDELPMLERFVGKALAEILAVARSQRLRLLVSCQHLAQLSEGVRASLLANAAVQAFFRLGPADARLVAGSLAAGEEASVRQVSARAERVDRQTGAPEWTTWAHPIRDAYGRLLRQASLSGISRGSAAVAQVIREAEGAGIPRLYVQAADTGEPVALASYVAGLPADEYWIEGPELRLVIPFPRPRLRVTGRSGEAAAVRRWTGCLQDLPVQHAVLRRAGSPTGSSTGMIRVRDVPVPRVDARRYREWVRGSERAHGQSAREQQECLEWRQAAIERIATGRPEPPARREEEEDGSLA